MTNVFDALLQTARRHPDHEAIVDCEQQVVITYGNLVDEIALCAARLRQAGVRPGDCVGLNLSSGRDYVVANYGLWCCGACVVPIPIELTARETREISSNIAVDSVISTAAGKAIFEGSNERSHTIGGQKSLLHLHPSHSRPAGFYDLNPAFIRFSSGTTGRAKGVVLSHETILERVVAVNDGFQLSPNDRIVCLLSMAYHFAASIVSYLTIGATIILPARRVDLGRSVLEAAAKHSATMIYGAPKPYALMAQKHNDYDLRSVRLAISTATSLPHATAQSFHRRFGIPLAQVYGIIEVGLPCMNLRFAGERFDTVGQVLPAYELRLLNLNRPSNVGEIHVRGKGLLDAYYCPWQTRCEILADGWFRTGDLGELDADGCLYIRGRSNEVINAGGMKFFPHEVEAVLESHPAIGQAAVFAMDGPSSDAACAQVVACPDVAELPNSVELRQFCAKHLAHFKVPQRIDYVSQLARTGSGKIIRRAPAQRPC